MNAYGTRLALLLLVVGTIGCDRVTKHLAAETLAGEPRQSFLADTVRLEYVENSGRFLSLGADLPPAVRTLLFTVGNGSILIGTLILARPPPLDWRGALRPRPRLCRRRVEPGRPHRARQRDRLHERGPRLAADRNLQRRRCRDHGRRARPRAHPLPRRTRAASARARSGTGRIARGSGQGHEAALLSHAGRSSRVVPREPHHREGAAARYYKKTSGKASVDWPQSVDEALCVGWIDGIRRSLDDERYTIRFTPRKTRSIWSAINIRRVEALTKEGRMRPSGLKAFEARRENQSGVYSYDSGPNSSRRRTTRWFARTRRAGSSSKRSRRPTAAPSSGG